MQVGAARTLDAVGRPPRSTWARGPPCRAGGVTPRPLQVGPDREEDRPPLLGRVGDDPLERGREAGHRGRDALASRALRRDRDRLQATAVVAPTGAPDADAVRPARRSRRASIAGPSGRAPGPRTAGSAIPPPVRSRSPTSPTGVPSRRAPGSDAPRLAQADELDAGRAAGPLEPGLQVRIVDRLHRASPCAADPDGEEEDRQLDRAEVEPDEEDGLARDDRLGDQLGRLEGEPLVQSARVTAGVRATSR